MRLSFRRGPELRRVASTLPAALYKQMRHLFNLHGEPSLFVPIRSMQYQAIIDEEEVVFVDGMGDRRIELAWQRFQPQQCRRLGDPIPYECVYYDEKGADTMRRLITEFQRALTLLENRKAPPPEAGAVVAPFKDRSPED